MPPGARRRVAVATLEPDAHGAHCCPRLHEAVELVGKRWSGAIIAVLLEGGAMRFSEIGQAIPQLSDRLLSERMKELEARGIVERNVHPDSPVRVEYQLTEMGRELAPTLAELKGWADRWLA
jgi:DNA-binding HxlR family transcriptional regulator